jgi:hypothetical protein
LSIACAKAVIFFTFVIFAFFFFLLLFWFFLLTFVPFSLLLPIACAQAVVAAQYKDLIAQLLVSSKEMEEKLLRVKKLRKGNKAVGMSDDDKIRLQLWLDVAAFRELVTSSFTPNEETTALLVELQQLVDESKPTDEPDADAEQQQ